MDFIFSAALTYISSLLAYEGLKFGGFGGLVGFIFFGVLAIYGAIISLTILREFIKELIKEL
jgi:hypothetical protein